ncbi:N-acetylmuramoyl-L-alanine amidase LytC precursor [Oxobacter pfennigii]|uniref:N-acetylmuramoyl-L-alanine amidase LytC n=1 Tax=Oxobacter pfennigii TaxID=36849 RepID=A0A0N8NSZ9_9CLOT|nr:cell wall-binding repeat-containing protein [Oxobacter pfennigii]KPU43440.1 N-acetylmuramoyl-L-alanine amidase LytC precursor [Oxobacter pfennigii]
MLNFKKIICAAIVAAALLTTGYQISVQAAPVSNRIAGNDRYQTAVEVSKQGWDKSSYAVLATGEDFPDALCAAPLARILDAPILLTGKNVLEPKVSDELARLGAKDVYIIGGTGVISDDVKKQVELLGIKTERVSGSDRYQTSLEIAKRIQGSTEVVIATGEDFPDALSIAPAAAIKTLPIILTPKDKVPDETMSYLSNSGFGKAYVVGGTGVINGSVMTQLARYNPERLWGNDRYETNIAIINKFIGDFKWDKVYVATGSDFPDALSASALAPKTASPVLLTDRNPGSGTRDFILNSIPNENDVVVIGGEGVISKVTMDILLDVSQDTAQEHILIDEGSFEYGGVVTLSNDSNFAISDITFEIDLGTLNSSPYQREESMEVTGKNVQIVTDSYGSKKAVIKLNSLDGKQKLDYQITRRFKNAGIKYNADLSKTAGNYSGFEGYAKYTASEDKIESDNAAIKKKALELAKGEKNPYIIARNIFEFVNTNIDYDFSEANKGALNALNTKKGVCEDFADLFVAMLRSLGIPARVVTGYWVEVENQSNMDEAGQYGHAWAEFYLPEYGWIPAEPTVIKTNLEKRIAAFEYFANFNDPGHFIRGYQNEISYSLKYYTNTNTDPNVNIITSEYIKKL